MARAGVIGSRAGTARRSSWVSSRIAAASNLDGAVTLETDMGELASNLAQEAADAVSGSMGERVPKYMQTVRSYWPYKTGFSQRMFRIKLKTVGQFFQVSIINAADYSGWIRHKNERPVLVAVRLLFDPFSPVALKIAEDIAEYLGDANG